MSEENLEVNNEQRILSDAEIQKRRNISNNANNVRIAADVASKSGNAYAMAAGKAVKVADKMTGGKASEKLGKTMNTANKLLPKGRANQQLMNRMSESGTSARIGSALSKKNSNAPTPSKLGGKSDASVKDKDSSFFSKKEVEEQTSDGGGVSFKATAKFLKTGLIAFTPIMVVVIFMNLIVAASQTYLQVIGLDHADSVSASDAETAIRDNGSEGLDDEITDENVGEGSANIGYIDIQDMYIDDNYKKFNKLNFISKTRNREYSESDLEELEDFYSGINSYEGHNMDTVYKFFFKLLYIQKHYKNTLDMPLIMSILSVEAEDKSQVFINNIRNYKISTKENNSYFDYGYDWSSYVLKNGNSEHDIEVLAKNMVTQTSNGDYKLVDEAEYKEFLKVFLEKKYFLDGYALGEISKEYVYINSENESAVNNLITQIYDAKEQYEDLAGRKPEEPIIHNASSNLYWWPIGSKETELINGVLYAKGTPQVTGVTSDYGGLDNFRVIEHGGIDIGNGGYGIGVINIIAAKSGEVVYPSQDYQTQYNDNGYYGNKDGGGYGNYIKIKHSDGSYTIYAHLAKNSITVRAGDVVSQGQVIGKMGHSGSSTGAHLHFEIRIGSDAKSSRANPLKYVTPENPRPMSYGGGSSFSLTTTTLSKQEFIARMRDYYDRTKKSGFYKNFVLNAEEVYDASIANNINPELVVVTAGTEQNWTLSSACQYTNNYWGIGISNGKGCNAGGIYDSLSEGIAAYATTLSAYTEYGSYVKKITNRYNERSQAGCDSSGHGLPGTFEGMQSVYSWVGNYRFNPGSSGSGGCYYLNHIYGKNYCSTVPTCSSKTATNDCPIESKTTVCEQNDYTAYQIKQKLQMRYDIFGL